VANKSGVAPQVISLPTGGGALQGLSETLRACPLHGHREPHRAALAAPGRYGFQPELALVYSTGSGNGPFGLGWSLNVPDVRPKTEQGVPLYPDGSPDPAERDTPTLSDADDLVAVESPPRG
jgi:hypothetical protein